MKYKFCPMCGLQLNVESFHGENVARCSNTACRFIFWQNSKPCATGIIYNADGKILMGIRGIEPDKGKLDLFGGFLKNGEQPLAGLKRELSEELPGTKLHIENILDFVIDVYGEGGDHTLNIGYLVKFLGGELIPSDDVVGYEWVDPKMVDFSRLAFKNNEEFIKIYNNRITNEH